MIAQDVVAVVYGRVGDGDGVRRAALEQERAPARVLAAIGLAEAVRTALVGGERWIWLLDGAAVPQPGALDALLAAADQLGPEQPLLLASVVVGPDGRLHPAALPQHEVFEKDRSVAAVRHRVVQLRAAAPGSVLVARSAAERFAPPLSDRPGGAELREWSVRILRRWDDPGYLVPASVAVRTAAAPGRSRTWAAAARLLASSGWSPTERLWEAYKLAGDLVAAVPGLAQGRAGVGAPGARPSRAPRSTIASTRGEKWS